MRIIINIGNDESDTKIQTNNRDEPGNGRNTTATECPAMNQDKDTVCSNQSKNRTRCSNTDILRRKVETGDNADYSCHQVNQQEAQVPKQALDKETKNKEVEHIQAYVQDIGMQENGRNEPPVLPGHNCFIVFCTVSNKYIGVLRISEHIRQDIVQATGT